MSAPGANGPRAASPADRRSLEVIVFGNFFLELVFGHVAGLPGPGEEIFTEEFALSCGGGVTVADAAVRGGARAGLAARLGTDLGSAVLERHCARLGIDLTPSRRLVTPTAGITVVVNFDGDRAFISHVPERPEGDGEAELEHWLSVLRAERPAWLEVHANPGVATLLEEARALGVRSAVDVSQIAIARHRREVLDCLTLADVFVPNEAELRLLTGELSSEAGALAATAWCGQVVLKQGAKGALLATPEGLEQIRDGLAEVTVRDRTGAGDAFAGGMLAALVRGASLPEAIVAGNAAGSEAVARLGGVGAVEHAGPGGERTDR